MIKRRLCRFFVYMKTFRIDGEIGQHGNTALDVQKKISDLNLSPTDEFKIIINSEGGSVFEGFKIYNHLKSLPNRLTIKVEGLCGSISTLIALAGDSLEMSEVGLWMVHRASVMASGNQDELKKSIALLENIDNTLISVYSKKTGKPREEIESIIAKETFYTSDDALSFGWVDKIVDPVGQRMAAIFKLNEIKMNKLQELYAKFTSNPKAIDGETMVEEAVEEQIETVTEEIPTAITVEEVAARVSDLEMQIQNLATVVEELVNTVSPIVEEEIPTVEEIVMTEDVAARIDAIVEAKFQAKLKDLPKSKGAIPRANGSFNGSSTPKWQPKNQGFTELMKGIDQKTRKN